MSIAINERHSGFRQNAGFTIAAVSFLALLASSLQAQVAPKRPRILGVSHVAVFVSDLVKTRAFYKDFLGFEEPFSLKKQDGTDWIAYIKVNDFQYIELFSGTAQNRGQLAHIAFYTENAAQLRDYLASRGVKIVEQLRKGQTGNAFFSIIDPDGYRIEIVEYQSGSWTALTKGKFAPADRISDHILHASLAIASSKASLEFYQDVLGLEVTGQGNNDDRTHWIDMRVPNTKDHLELVVSDTPGGTKSQKIQNYLCLERPNLQAAASELQARGTKVAYPHPLTIQLTNGRSAHSDLFDPDGMQIELMEPSANQQATVSPGKVR